MNRLIKILFIVVLMFTLPVYVSALSLSKTEVTIAKEEETTVELFANIDEEANSVDFGLFYSTYDIPATFHVNDSYTYSSNGGSYHKVTFNKPESGKIKLGTITIKAVANPKTSTGIVSLSDVSATLTSGKKKMLNERVINVKIVEKEDQEPNNPSPNDENKGNEENNDPSNNTKQDEDEYNNLLERIDSKIVNIKLKEDVYDYVVSINPTVKELDLKPVLKDDSYKVEVSNQKIEELEDNKITITISKEDIKKVYTVRVRIANDVEVDDSKFTPTNSYKGIWIFAIVLLLLLLAGAVILLRIRKK